MSQLIHAVLFDLDGTLLDTAHDLLHAINLTLDEYDKPRSDYATLRQFISGGIAAMVSNTFNIDTQHTHYETIKQRCLTHYQTHINTKTCFFDGVEALLDHLDHNHIPWGIVTNKSTRFTLPTLKSFGLDKRAKCVVCADTLEHMKPHPAPLLHACQQLNCTPHNTLYVGDYETDVLASRRAGMPCIILRYGYYPANTNPEDWQADLTIHHPSEIITYLQNLTPGYAR